MKRESRKKRDQELWKSQQKQIKRILKMNKQRESKKESDNDQ